MDLDSVNEYNLANKWSLYIHLQNTEDWSFESYHNILEITNVSDAVSIIQELNFELIKKTIIFIMKDNIKPMWEDESNKKGGGFSFKIHNKNVEYVWKRLFYALVGGTITTNKKVYENITGISLSPKKSFCIIKIWMRNCDNLNHNVFIDIDYLDKKGCLFKKHETE